MFVHLDTLIKISFIRTFNVLNKFHYVSFWTDREKKNKVNRIEKNEAI